MGQFIGAIDQGTTSTRFIVFDRAGEIVASAQKEHAQIYPQPGWVEHAPMEIWRQHARGHRARRCSAAKLTARDLAAVGITNQRETTVLWDRRSGAAAAQRARLAGHARRSAGRVLSRAEGGKDRFRAQHRTAARELLQRPQAALAARQCAGARERSAAPASCCSARSTRWLLWNLTGGARGGLHVTDVTNASRTQLMNLATLEWDDEMLDAFDIPRDVLPRIVSSSEVYGEIATGPLRACPSPASSAISRRRWSARPAFSPARRRTRTAPAVSC